MARPCMLAIAVALLATTALAQAASNTTAAAETTYADLGCKDLYVRGRLCGPCRRPRHSPPFSTDPLLSSLLHCYRMIWTL